MFRKASFMLALLLAAVGIGARGHIRVRDKGRWQFAVSGDSRNCGNVVMPAIAQSVLQHRPEFYWHLGDFRKVYDFDEDLQHEPEWRARTPSIIEYESRAWDDFIQNQVVPFGSLEVFLGIGNHETIPPKTRDEYVEQFADWLEAPRLREQRLRDDPRNHLLRAYYHWVEAGVDFINMDNATYDQFDDAQVGWFERVLERDEASSDIKSIVVGMHRALPESISRSHSMNESPTGTESGLRVYGDLLKAQNDAHKHVYLLASHSHFFMDGTFNTEYWRTHGGVLPGWIVGTAGAVRYLLPENWKDARAAETNVYGYLLGTVEPDGEIRLDFQKLNETDVPAAVVSRFTPEFAHWCFAENRMALQSGP
jgi:hypothetical protein